MQAVRKTEMNEKCIATKIVCAQGKQKHLLSWELPENEGCHAVFVSQES
jgi:hypothetical protein